MIRQFFYCTPEEIWWFEREELTKWILKRDVEGNLTENGRDGNLMEHVQENKVDVVMLPVWGRTLQSYKVTRWWIPIILS